MARTTSTRRARIAVPIALALTLGAGLAACGSSTDTASSTTTTTTTSPSGGSVASQVDNLTNLSAQLKTATFQADYTFTTGGDTSTVTYSQSPPKYLFKLSSGVLAINDGTNSYYCSANKTCLKTASSPIASELAMFDGTSFAAAAHVFSVAAPILSAMHVDVSFSDASYGGQASTCMTATYTTNSTSATYCVATATGLLTYWSVGTTSYSLTSYSSSPPDSDFTVPSDYTTVSVP